MLQLAFCGSELRPFVLMARDQVIVARRRRQWVAQCSPGGHRELTRVSLWPAGMAGVNRLLRISMVPLAVVAATVALPPSPAEAGRHGLVTLAVIGDVPYGTDQEARFGSLVSAVNADPAVRLAVHVGDIKSGSTTCADERFAAVRAAFDTFDDPLVYTPGDNEWTDCHRANNGAYNPLERLDELRAVFFPAPGRTLGRHSRHVRYQPSLVENVRWSEESADVELATVHVIGSDNGLAPWTGLGFTAPTPEQIAEVQARTDADLAWIDTTFDRARRAHRRGIVLFMQADTWNPAPSPAQQAVVDRIVARTAAFDGSVLVVQGDSHVYRTDDPAGLPNLTRIVIHGETLPFEYLRLTIDRRDPHLFRTERVPITVP
jgi:hypothetical protein